MLRGTQILTQAGQIHQEIRIIPPFIRSFTANARLYIHSLNAEKRDLLKIPVSLSQRNVTRPSPPKKQLFVITEKHCNDAAAVFY